MNIWKQFERLQKPGGQDLRVAEVITVYDTETLVEDAGGQQYRALGTDHAAGQMVFIRDGAIIGQAPSLTNAGIVYV